LAAWFFGGFFRKSVLKSIKACFVTTNTIHYQPRPIVHRQKECDKIQVELADEKPKKEQHFHTLFKHQNGETLKLVHLIKQLENENHRLERLLEDFENDKLFQAQRIKELEQEKSAIKNTLANIVSENQTLKDQLYEIEMPGKKSPHFIDLKKESHQHIREHRQQGLFDIIGLFEKTKNYYSILTSFIYYKLIRLPKQD
jgi:hypothetical protein